MKTLVYLFGQPGAGKTTLMRSICASARPLFVADKPVKHRGFVGTSGMFSVLGADGNPFGGTDTLSYTAVGTAAKWLAKLASCAGGSLVFAEGDRLANQRFFDEAKQHYNLVLFYLDCPSELAESRRRQRADAYSLTLQNAVWVKSRMTKHLNLAKSNPGTIRLAANDRPNDLANSVWKYINATQRQT